MVSIVRMPSHCRRSDYIIEGVCNLFDGIILLLTLGRVRGGMHIWWIDKLFELYVERATFEPKEE